MERLESVVPDGPLTSQSVIGRRPQRSNAYDLGLAMVAGRSTGWLRPYALLGIGYYSSDTWDDHEPFLYGAGVAFGGGVTTRVLQMDVGIEVALRAFGGYLAGTAGERTYAPVTLTVGW